MHSFLDMRSKLARAVFAVAVLGSLGLAGCRQTPAGTGGAGADQGSPTGMVARTDTEPFPGSRTWAPPDRTAYLQTGLSGQHWEQGLDTRESVQGDFGAKPEPAQEPPPEGQKKP